jgi:hypothetical protein
MAVKIVDEIKNLGVTMDGRLSFLPHIEAIISKSSRILGLIKSISHKTLINTLLVKLNLEHAAFVRSPHQSVHSEWLEQRQHSFIHYAVRRLPPPIKRSLGSFSR